MRLWPSPHGDRQFPSLLLRPESTIKQRLICHPRPVDCRAGLPPEAHPPATQGPSTCHPRPVHLPSEACPPLEAGLLPKAGLSSQKAPLAMGSTSISKSPVWVPELPTFVHGWLSKYCCSEGMWAGGFLLCHLAVLPLILTIFSVYSSVVLPIFTLLCNRYLEFWSFKTETLHPSNNFPFPCLHPKILLFTKCPSRFKIQFWFYMRQEIIFIEDLLCARYSVNYFQIYFLISFL